MSKILVTVMNRTSPESTSVSQSTDMIAARQSHRFGFATPLAQKQPLEQFKE